MGGRDAFERIAAIKPEPVEVEVGGEMISVHLREPSLADKVAMTKLVLAMEQMPQDHDGDVLMDQITPDQMGSMMEVKYRALQRVLCEEDGTLFYDDFDAMAGTLRPEIITPLADIAWDKFGLSQGEQDEAAGN